MRQSAVRPVNQISPQGSPGGREGGGGYVRGVGREGEEGRYVLGRGGEAHQGKQDQNRDALSAAAVTIGEGLVGRLFQQQC